MLCKHRLPLTKSGLIHRETSPTLTNANGNLPLGRVESYVARGKRPQSVLVRAVVWDTEADRERHPRRHWSLPSLRLQRRSLPSISSRGSASSPVSTPRAKPPAQVGSIATGVLTGLPRRDGPGGSPVLPLSGKPPQDPKNPASVGAVRRRRLLSRCPPACRC